MEQIIPGDNDFPKVKKTLLDILFFILSIAAVVVILTRGSEDGRLSVFGTTMVVTFCYTVLYLFLLHFRQEVLQVNRKTFFILLAIITFLLITRLVLNIKQENIIFIVPFAVIPVIIRTFYDSRLALFILLITIMLAGFMVPEPFEFILMNFLSGMMAIFTLTNNFRKSRLFFTSLMVIVSYAVIYLGMNMIKGGVPESNGFFDYLLFAGNGLLVLISFPLIFLFEQKFLLISDTTLLMLADPNQPLLRKLAVEAPGSYQHSLQVANIAEEASRVIGANMHLTRTGALYHDIGKVANPSYYIENIADGVSPHEKLDPRDSAKVIINHVRQGVVLAKNYKIPVQVIDFIRTHHGTSVAYFFYKKHVDQNPGEKDNTKAFTYPGPKPFSKETAIVMMADAVEASSRSLEKYTEEGISELVERIMYLQEQDGQYSDVPLTYKDISDIKSVFKKRLQNIYHVRVAYPDRI
ncbi:MAG TPA: HDIG domain-containing protein [Bacteroidales bacterium]|nr:HDIG domain-containing protein [Bacteroidales bacterium]HQK68660.1 HDIG domain-containing protein [Bacteroidales bacterium]